MAPTFPLTTARARLGELVNRAVYGREPIVLTEHGREVAAIISVDELAHLQAAADRADQALATRVATSGVETVPHDVVMAAMDALDETDRTTSPDIARAILAPHTDLLSRAEKAARTIEPTDDLA